MFSWGEKSPLLIVDTWLRKKKLKKKNLNLSLYSYYKSCSQNNILKHSVVSTTEIISAQHMWKFGQNIINVVVQNTKSREAFLQFF